MRSKKHPVTPKQKRNRRAARLAPSKSAVAATSPPPAAAGRSVVGIGASAGGLEAFSQLLHALDAGTGMSFVLVQHLSPDHKSFLSELLAIQTSLPVVQVTNGIRLRPNHVYVIPPNADMTIAGGALRLEKRPDDRSQHMPIDSFFRSLAQWSDGHAIGIVLSGTASDGANGLRDIKAAGGITMAQDPATAKYDGMPRAAIATGIVDIVASPAALAAEIGRISSHPSKRILDAKHDDVDAPQTDSDLARVFHLLRRAIGVDFSQYKPATIRRRLQRRMVLNKIATLEQYVRFLDENPSEARSLYEDLLIHVTSFFREPDSFEALCTKVLPALVGKSQDESLRVWVPGCSTGEEAYSVAICLLEALDASRSTRPVQVFATDVSELAVQRARAGSYDEAIAGDVGPARLKRFFTRLDGRYAVTKPLRECCIFARQDITRDPPFSKIDLVLCRNVLIYLGPQLQRRLIALFHYALKPGGLLMLGSAETVGAHADLFAPFDKSNRIYARKDDVVRPNVMAHVQDPYSARVGASPPAAPRPDGPNLLHQEANHALIARYAPPGVVVDRELRIVQFRGQTGAYLEAPSGEPNLSVLKMVREGLLNGVRAAIDEARRTDRAVRRHGLQVRHDGKLRRVDVVVLPLPAKSGGRHDLVLFEEAADTSGPPSPPRARAKASRAGRGPAKQAEVEHLQKELAASRDYLQSINQDLEAANEELQSANEEILSNNEELQSTNEELDTAKEELQSTNEELNTVNDELRGRNDELGRLNSDLLNLIASVQIAIVIVGSDLRIRRFTPMAEKVLNLIATDVGRPLGDLQPNVDGPRLDSMITNVIDTMTIQECEVRDRQGRSFQLRVRPYKDLENRIDGAVLTLIDVDAAVRAKGRVDRALELARAVIATVREPLLVLDQSLKVERMNRAFARRFAIQEAQAIGVEIGALGCGFNDPALLRRLSDVVTTGTPLDDFAMEIETPGAGRERLILNARRVEREPNDPHLLLLAIHFDPGLADGADRGEDAERRG